MAGPYEQVGTDYRQLEAPEEVRTDLPNNEAAARAAALSGLFKEFEGVSGDIANKNWLQAGAIAGAASGATGHPQYKQGLARITAYGRAFNNAATGAYAIEAEAQADDSYARLRVQANNNPGTFRATYSAVRDGVIKNAPPEAQAMLTELYNKRLAAGLAAITGDQLTQQRELQRQTYDLGIDRLTRRIAILQGSGNKDDQLAAMDEHVKLSTMIHGGVEAGLYSDAEARAKEVNSMRTITAQVFQTQVDRELAKPDGDVVTLLERFRQAHIDNLTNPNEQPILAEPEFQKLMADATTKIREYNLMVAMNKREGKTAEQLKFEASDQAGTSLLLEGKLTERWLDDQVRTSNMKPETARALRSAMLSNALNAPAKSDPAALYKLLHDPEFLDMTGQDIAGYPGSISTQDRLNAVREQQKRLDSWENTQSVKDAKRDIDVALKIPPGTPSAALSDDQRKARDLAQQALIHELGAADPAQRDRQAAPTAQKVIKQIQRQEAASDVDMLTRGKQNFINTHGPGSAAPADEKAFKDRLKWYDDQIAQRAAAAKAE